MHDLYGPGSIFHGNAFRDFKAEFVHGEMGGFYDFVNLIDKGGYYVIS